MSAVKEGLVSIAQALAIDGEVPDDGLAAAHAWAGWMTQLIDGATPAAVDHVKRALVIGRSASVRTFCVAVIYASILRAFRGLGNEAVSVVDEAYARLAEEPDRLARAEATSATLAAYTTLTLTGSNSFNASMLATRLGNLAALQGQFE
jgi:hypothetical protein